MMHYIKYALDDKNYADYFTVALAYEIIKILKIHNDIIEVKDFLEHYMYGISHMEQRIQAYQQIFTERTNNK